MPGAFLDALPHTVIVEIWEVPDSLGRTLLHSTLSLIQLSVLPHTLTVIPQMHVRRTRVRVLGSIAHCGGSPSFGK